MRRFLDWWAPRSRWTKAALIVLASFVVILILAALFPSEDEEQAGTGSPTVTEATATTATEPEPEPPPPPPEEDEDTGRMSEGEYEQFSSQVADVDQEVAEFGESIPKCGVLFQAQELAAASECIEEADNGVGDDMLGAYATAEGLESDVGKACLRNLKAYRTRLDVFYGWFQQTTKAGKGLQFAEFNQLAQLSGVMTRRYHRAKGAALASCKPL